MTDETSVCQEVEMSGEHFQEVKRAMLKSMDPHGHVEGITGCASGSGGLGVKPLDSGATPGDKPDAKDKAEQKRQREQKKKEKDEEESKKTLAMSPNTKNSRECKQKLKDELKSTKALVEKISKELLQVKVAEKNIESKPWGQQATVFLKEKTEEQTQSLDGLLAEWVAGNELDHSPMSNADEVKKQVEVLETKKEQVEFSFKTFKKNVLAEFLSG